MQFSMSEISSLFLKSGLQVVMKLLNFSSNVVAEIFMIKTDQVMAASGVFFFR